MKHLFRCLALLLAGLGVWGCALAPQPAENEPTAAQDGVEERKSVYPWQSEQEQADRRKGYYEKAADMEFVWVEGGCFQMGSDNGAPTEAPVHEVCVDGFFMGKTEMTQSQWERLMKTNPSIFREPERPVENVSWNEAQKFIEALNRLSNKDYRLPTEAEWEFAARGGLETKGFLYAGSNNCEEIGCTAYNSQKETAPVGQKKPNELGLYDMSGNVAEWCLDWYRKDYYSYSPRENPQGPAPAVDKIVRGSHYRGGEKDMRVSKRDTGSPSGRGPYIGLRLVLPRQLPKALASNVDIDGDGVLDDRDLCPDTPKGTTVDPGGCSSNKP